MVENSAVRPRAIQVAIGVRTFLSEIDLQPLWDVRKQLSIM